MLIRAATPASARPRRRPPVGVATLTALAAAAVLLGACSPAAPGTSGPTPSPTFSPIPPGDASGIPTLPPSNAPSASPAAAAPGLLLAVTNEGGFINPAASIGALPAVIVDADGRIYTPGRPADGSSPMVPLVEVRDTGPAGATAILAAMKAAGLDTEGAGGGVAADTGTTVFTATFDGTTVVNRVSGGGIGGPGGPGGPGHPGASGSPGASGAPGAAAMALLARLADPAETWSATAAPPATAYAPVGYRLWLAPGDAVAPGVDSVPWPLAGDPAAFGSPVAADFGITGLRSDIVTGPDAVALAKAVARAPVSSVMISSSKGIFGSWIRPLFPDELGG